MKHDFRSAGAPRRIRRIATFFMFAFLAAPAFADVPTATAVSINGVPALGELLTGVYTYGDVDGDVEGASTFEWRRDGTPIATTLTYTVTTADQGTTLVFEVTPMAATGENPGLAVASAGVSITPNAVPTATAVSISGVPALGELLSGLYTYGDVDGDAEGVSTFEWRRDGIPIATTLSYTVTTADQGTTLVFAVTPIAATGTSPGLTVASTGVAIAANAVPTATLVAISGTPAAGQELVGSYTYSDVEGDLEGVSTFRWLRDGLPVGGAVLTTYMVTGADKDTSLQFEVTPVAVSGTSPGVPALSAAVAVGNVAPVITGQQIVSSPEDTALLMTLDMLIVTDPDNVWPTDFSLAVQDSLVAGYTRVGNTITPLLDFSGDLSVPVTVNDGTSDSAVFNVVVTITAVNDQPVITAPLSLSTPEDTSLTVLITDLTITDPDNIFPDDFVLLLLEGLNYTLTGNTITPDENFNGVLTVSMTVTDNSGELNATSVPFLLAVDVAAENDGPVVALPIEDQVAVEGSAFDLDISLNFTDADLDPLQFTATGLPPSGNLVFDPLTGIFSGTPRQEDARDNDPYIIIVTATDGVLSTIPPDEFELNISALDRANVSLDISVAPDPAMLNDELSWTLTASNSVGPQQATNVELTGSFVGSGLNISSTGSCTIQAAVGQVRDFDCLLGGLPVGGSTAVVFTTTTSTPGDVVVFASALSSDVIPIDPNIDDNSSQLAVGVAEAFSNGAVQVLGNSQIRAIAAGDINGDGAVDLVAGTAAGQPIQIYLSDGFRDFAATAISLADNSSNEGIAVADFDANGTLDLVVANGGGQADIVYSNDGAGNFTVMATLGVTFSQDVAVGDFDNDGNADDVVFATIQGNPVYLGDGSGGFTLDTTLGNSNSHSVAVAKLNSDARDDIVFANTGSDSQIWIKNAAAGFSQGDVLAIGDAAAVTVGEFGGDSRPDLAFGRVSPVPGDLPANPVLINNGAGGFGTPFAALGTSSSNDIHAADVNRDGLTDLVFINSSGVHQIWTATGSGFDLYREQIVDSDSTVGIVTELGMADVGDAGGVDLALGGAAVSGLGIFLNDGFGNLGLGDAVPPVLTLVGNSSVSTPSGSAYSDAGASAEDNIDGDISGSVVATGAVNTAVVGNYTVTYNVSDRAGNRATAITRTVTVTTGAGTGGGGGGTLSLLVLLLIISACVSAYDRNRVAISDGDKNMNQRGTGNA